MSDLMENVYVSMTSYEPSPEESKTFLSLRPNEQLVKEKTISDFVMKAYNSRQESGLVYLHHVKPYKEYRNMVSEDEKIAKKMKEQEEKREQKRKRKEERQRRRRRARQEAFVDEPETLNQEAIQFFYAQELSKKQAIYDAKYAKKKPVKMPEIVPLHYLENKPAQPQHPNYDYVLGDNVRLCVACKTVLPLSSFTNEQLRRRGNERCKACCEKPIIRRAFKLGPDVRFCSACQTVQPVTNFSKRQLSRIGLEKCKDCIKKQLAKSSKKHTEEKKQDSSSTAFVFRMKIWFFSKGETESSHIRRTSVTSFRDLVTSIQDILPDEQLSFFYLDEEGDWVVLDRRSWKEMVRDHSSHLVKTVYKIKVVSQQHQQQC